MPENQVDDLWPQDLAIEPLRTPIDILREQGGFLTNRTGGRLQVRVATEPSVSRLVGDSLSKFRHRMLIVVPALENYEYEVLTLYQGFHFYPVSGTLGGTYDDKLLGNEAELLAWLKRCFESSKVKDTINTLFTLASRQ